MIDMCFLSCVQIKKLGEDNNCPTTKLVEGKMASQGWCADRLGEWVKKNPTKGANEAKEKLESEFGIKLKYLKSWFGLKFPLSKFMVRMRKASNSFSIRLLILNKFHLVVM
jgi:hypothetical protein